MSLVLLGILNSQVSGGAGLTDAYEHLETTTLASTAGSVTFSNLDTSYGSDYKHLIVRTYLGSIQNTALLMRINGDSNANYYHTSFLGRSTTEEGRTTNQNSAIEVFRGVMDDSPSDKCYQHSTFILYDWQSSKRKAVQWETGYGDDFPLYESGGGQWDNSAAISSLEFSASYDFRVASSFSIYGVRG